MADDDDGEELQNYLNDQDDDIQRELESDSDDEKNGGGNDEKELKNKDGRDIEMDDFEDDDEEPPATELDVILAIKVLQEKIKRKVIYKEFSLYFVFVIFFLTAVFLARNVTEAYQIRQTLTNSFLQQEFPAEFSYFKKTFASITEVDEWWDWVEGVFLQGIDDNEWYNNQTTPGVDQNYVATYNLLLGGFRFRQLRVANNSCIIDKTFKPLFSTCYWTLTTLTNSHTSFGPDDQFRYYPASDIGGKLYLSDGVLLPAGGFIHDFRVGSNYEEQIQYLKISRWIDKSTRAVFVHLNVMSQNLYNHVVAATFLMELDPGGSIRVTSFFDVVRLDLYTSPLDYFRLCLELSVIGFIVFYMIRVYLELLLAHKKGLLVQYISDPWNFLDLTTLAIFVVVIWLQIAYAFSRDRRNLDFTRRNYIQIEGITTRYVQIYNLNALNLLLCFLKMFKYLRVNERMSMLWKTLERASGDLINYFLIFVIVFLGFSFMGHLLFGTDMQEFSELSGAILTCFNMMVGNFPDGFLEVNRIMSPIFFFLFVCLVFFIMLNIFLAIINEAYTEENDLLRLSSKTFPQQLQRGIATLLSTLSAKKQKKDDPLYLTDNKLLSHLEAVKKSRRPKISFDEINQLGKIEPERLQKLARQATLQTTRDQSEESDEVQLVIQLKQQIEKLTKKLKDIN